MVLSVVGMTIYNGFIDRAVGTPEARPRTRRAAPWHRLSRGDATKKDERREREWSERENKKAEEQNRGRKARTEESGCKRFSLLDLSILDAIVSPHVCVRVPPLKNATPKNQNVIALASLNVTSGCRYSSSATED